MKTPLRARADKLIAREMAAYRAARSAGQLNKAWHALERAHIVAQPFLRQHIANHTAMLVLAFVQRDWSEVAGQISRLALAPLGALTGRIPIGNTGRANVSAFQPMTIPADLESCLIENDR